MVFARPFFYSMMCEEEDLFNLLLLASKTLCVAVKRDLVE